MKIIVRGANWIGDAVMTIPALRFLREIYPDANITLYTKKWAEGVFQDADFIDRILVVENEGSGFRDTVREAKRVSAGQYDLGILFTNSFQSAAVMRFAGVKKRVGYSREGRGILLTSPIKPPEWKIERHEVHYYLNLAHEFARRQRLEIGNEEIRSSLPVSDERRMKARERMAEAGTDLTKPIIGLGVGSTNSQAKRWGEAKYAELADLFSGSVESNLVMFGSKEEAEIAGQVAALTKVDLIDLTGSTDLAMATAMLAELDLFISNDMGLAHLAAAVETKTLVVFGPTKDVTTRPFGENAQVIRHPVECSPCMLRKCPIDHRCMTRLSPESVFVTAMEMLNE